MHIHVSVFDKVLWCSVAQCYDNTWAMLVQSKIKLSQYCQLVGVVLLPGMDLDWILDWTGI